MTPSLLSHPLIRKRFLAKLNKTESCWLWTGAITKNTGYGHFNTHDRDFTDHRFSWMMHRGDIPKGLLVLHHCDVRPCANPEHLYLGTHQDNSNDKRLRGREAHRRGEDNNAKLTTQKVVEIRSLLGVIPQRAIAERFGISKGHVNAIAQRRKWAHVL